jgi:hypothetical protein
MQQHQQWRDDMIASFGDFVRARACIIGAFLHTYMDEYNLTPGDSPLQESKFSLWLAE